MPPPLCLLTVFMAAERHAPPAVDVIAVRRAQTRRAASSWRTVGSLTDQTHQ